MPESHIERMTIKEIEGLCDRLDARGNSPLLRDQPEQQSDLRTAAALLRLSLFDKRAVA